MTAAESWLIVGMALVTFGVRYPVLALMSRITLPPTVLAALKYIPPAVLAAIIAPAVLAPGGGALRFDPGNAYLVGGFGAVLLAWRTRHLLATIVFGMTLFWLWRWLAEFIGWSY